MLLMTRNAHRKYTTTAKTKYARRYQSSAFADTAGKPTRGRFERKTPPRRGQSITVQKGNGWRVRCARITFVVMRPKTKDIVRQKRTRWFSRLRVEYGE